ncbi:NPC intracellular cholesterol transporter 2-like [Haliotis rufescens]|uniref:NPC intracellular cholesterol transporter 2-like n=1 Tax=Haliotis rufescens TaxID=6454 RepID=UPI001EB06BBE|nr:NPC intracellular cholesterol transporter 2-like [Haliotis rufescens]
MESKLLTVAVLFGVLSIVHSQGPQWKPCDSSKYEGVVATVGTNATVTGGVVQLVKGTGVIFDVSFKTNIEVTSATAVVHGIIAGVPVPFPLDNPQACKDSGLTCPLKTGTGYKYKSVIPVKSYYPDVRLVVKWQLNDEKANIIWCVEMPAEIK